MNHNNCNVFNEELPERISRKETYELFKEYKKGNMNARNLLIEHNMRFVLYRVLNKFGKIDYEKDELVSIGLIGLIKAVDTFDYTKGYEFATYAIKCIDNEIYMLLRKLKKEKKIVSLSSKVLIKSKSEIDYIFDSNLTLKDVLGSTRDNITSFQERHEQLELYKAIHLIINDLTEEEQKLLMVLFGFNDSPIYNQSDIAKMLNVTQGTVSKRKIKLANTIGEKLNELGYIEINNKVKKL